jgi:SAM-dependent methyltransferase
MNQPPAQPDTILSAMEALGDPTRLRLLRLLERHELGVVELCDVLQLPQSTVSRHLKILLDRGWLRARKQATTHLYRMILDELPPPTRRLWLLTREQTDQWATVQQDQLRLARRLRERQRHSQQFFAGAVGQWDRLRREMYGDRFNLEALLSLLPDDMVVADLGCGTAHLATEIAPRVARVIAVDNSPAMLKAARKRTAHLPNVDLRQGELDALPIDDHSCDAALLVLVLTYAPEPAGVLREMCRILKPGGKAVLVDLLPHDRDDFRRQMEQQHPGFAPAELQRLLLSAGLGSPVIRPLASEANTRGPTLFLATARRI